MKEINKRTKYFIFLIVILVITIIGVSFAYFRSNVTDTNPNHISSLSCLSTSITSNNSAINLASEFPISNSDGMNYTPYTFTITNNCGKYVAIDISLEKLASSTISSSYVRVCLNNTGITTDNSVLLSSLPAGTALNGGTAYILKQDSLNANESKTYDFRMWIDEPATTDEVANTTMTGIIIITNTAKSSTTTAS